MSHRVPVDARLKVKNYERANSVSFSTDNRSLLKLQRAEAEPVTPRDGTHVKVVVHVHLNDPAELRRAYPPPLK